MTEVYKKWRMRLKQLGAAASAALAVICFVAVTEADFVCAAATKTPLIAYCVF